MSVYLKKKTKKLYVWWVGGSGTGNYLPHLSSFPQWPIALHFTNQPNQPLPLSSLPSPIYNFLH